jgi:hypothetical protein
MCLQNQMFRVNAPAIKAQMIHGNGRWNFDFVGGVGCAVNPKDFFAYADLAIAIVVSIPIPNPTRGCQRPLG